jgi:hypothetical protein
MERIFEKVMLRKMTEEEKEVLHLNGHVKPSKKHSRSRAGIFHKMAPVWLRKLRLN